MPASSLVKEVQLRSVRESVTEKVLQAAKAILSLSSYLGTYCLSIDLGVCIFCGNCVEYCPLFVL